MGIGNPDSEQVVNEQTESGLEVNVASAIAYVLGFITGIVMLLVETENDHVRFHAAQSIVVFVGLFVGGMALSVLQMVVMFGSFIGAFLGMILSLASLLLWLGGLIVWAYLIIRAYQGSDPRIPVAAGIAEGLV